MPTTFDNEEYFDTDEAMDALGVSRQHFYTNVRPRLRVYRFETKQKPWYRQRDILDLKEGRAERQAPPIVIPGIFSNWTDHVRSLGLQVDTLTREVTIVSLDAEQLPATFRVEPNQQFVKRTRISFINRQPIATWASYYPLHLVRGEILDEMKAGEETDVVKRIAETHGLVIGWARDRYSARLASLEEQELLMLLRDEPVMILQRASYASDKKTLVLYSDMSLLGSWFAPEHEYPVNIWQPGPAPVSPAAHRARGDITTVWLSDTLCAWRSFVRFHGMAETTVHKAIQTGRIPIVEGNFRIGKVPYKEAFDAAGRAAFYSQYHGNPNFKPCSDCPHL